MTAKRLLVVIAVGLLLAGAAPLVAAQVIYAFSLHELGEPPLVAAQTLPAATVRVFWIAAGERLPPNVERLAPWRYGWAIACDRESLRQRRPGERMAWLAARAWLSRRPPQERCELSRMPTECPRLQLRKERLRACPVEHGGAPSRECLEVRVHQEERAPQIPGVLLRKLLLIGDAIPPKPLPQLLPRLMRLRRAAPSRLDQHGRLGEPDVDQKPGRVVQFCNGIALEELSRVEADSGLPAMGRSRGSPVREASAPRALTGITRAGRAG